MTEHFERILVALDTTDVAEAKRLAGELAGAVGGVKLGLEFFNSNGPDAVRAVAAVGQKLFLDLKFHDIPTTVAGAVRAVVPLAPAIINVHAAGGAAMMRAAAEATAEAAASNGTERPMVVAVTVLTSLDEDDLAAVGQSGPAGDQAVRLAELARAAGLDGAVCSPREAAAVRAACGPDFKLIVPGIRPNWTSADDQKRITTPADAVAAGADYLVIGRPITTAPDPLEAAKLIAEELAAA